MLRSPESKSDFYPRYFAFEFGNQPRTWKSVEDCLDSDFRGTVTVRDPRPGGVCKYRIPTSSLGQFLGEDVNVNESMDDERLTIQGEVRRCYESGLELRYSHLKVPMRLAMTEALFATGLRAKLLLQHHLDSMSLEWLDHLLDYQTKLIPELTSPVIEFSSYDTPVGALAYLGANTVFWEVRNY